MLIGELRAWGPEGDRRADYGRRVLEICEVLGNHCYHAGVVNPANMHQYYPLADLVVVPSEFEEPFGMVAIEAMSCGTPVLATRRGGLPEIITNDVTGFLLDDAKDYAAFASRLNELLDGPARLEGVSRTARTYVEQRHDWNMVTQQLESLYDRLLERHPLNTPA